MITSERGIALIKKYEKFMPQAYICPAGKLTIGYGHVVLPTDNFTHLLTEPEACELLAKDLASREAAINSMVKVPINQNQFDALSSFAFNVGIIALKGSSLMRFLNNKRYEFAAAEFLKWNKATVKGQLVLLAGLARRRKEEHDLFEEA